LQQEFELLNLSLGSVKMEDVSSGKRSCKFTATVAANQVISLNKKNLDKTKEISKFSNISFVPRYDKPKLNLKMSKAIAV
jgi:hypothetical protein